MANKDDLETARNIATIQEWRKGVDKSLDDHHSRIGEVEKCQQSITNARKLIIPFITLGALAALVLSSIVFSVVDPASAKEILKSLMPQFISALSR